MIGMKQKWLCEVVTQHSLQNRESYWLLTYLLEHETILKNVHFVERCAATPRGLEINLNSAYEPFVFYKNGQAFFDYHQIFHEIRLHWQDDLYVEIKLERPSEHLYHLAVLEVNPYIDSVEQEKEWDAFFHELHRERQWHVVNRALDQGDIKTFQNVLSQLDSALN